MKSKMIRKLVVLIGFVLVTSSVMAQISTDVGLTPAQDRWIFRSQFRSMGMESEMMEVNTHMVPVMLGYGVTSGVAVMARTVYVSRAFGSGRENRSGFNDPFLLSKFRLYRKNTASYTLGVAPFLASNIPVGADAISDGSWNPEAGVNISFRPRFMAVDLSVAYRLNDVLDKEPDSFSHQVNIDLALSGMIPIKNSSQQAFSPVLEINFTTRGSSIDDNPAQWLFVSPGGTYRYSSFAFDLLYQLPAYQTDRAGQMTQMSRWIAGVRYMF